jgi:hypothetical protein
MSKWFHLSGKTRQTYVKIINFFSLFEVGWGLEESLNSFFFFWPRMNFDIFPNFSKIFFVLASKWTSFFISFCVPVAAAYKLQ